MSGAGRSKGKAPKKPAVSEEDKAMFMAAMGGATPLGTRDRVPVPPKPAAPKATEAPPPEVKLAVDGDSSRHSARVHLQL